MRDGGLVVVDVDNTLYDWVALWAGAFDAMITTLTRATQTGRDEWLDAAHMVHVRRGATECPSLVADLVAGPAWPAAVAPAALATAAAAAYREYWDRHLAPYAGMREALTEVAARGHMVVAYTEGDVTIAASRIARLGLAAVIRRVFGRAPLPHPADTAFRVVETARNCPIAVDFIPREDNKPNPAGLRRIMVRCETSAEQILYVGDNLYKDIVMAQALGARAAWARYGTTRLPAHVALLERVAHWNARDTRAERAVTPHTVVPDVVLDDPGALPAAVAQRALAAH